MAIWVRLDRRRSGAATPDVARRDHSVRLVRACSVGTANRGAAGPAVSATLPFSDRLA